VRAWFANEMLASHEVWVIETGPPLGGFLALSLDRDWVEHLYVRPQAQGRGLGGSLLDLAKSRSSGSLSLWAFQRNRAARTFYERRGFRPVHFGDGRTNQEGEPDVRYLWQAAPEMSG
jgi:GNAT superfamily N-acetyltransferase